MAELAAQAQVRYRVRATDPAALTAALAARGVDPGRRWQCPEWTFRRCPKWTLPTCWPRWSRPGVRVVAFEPLGSNLESVYLAMTEERR